MTPVNGKLSCLFIGGYASGDALIVFLIGDIGIVHLLPIPIIICSAVGMVFIVGGICVYRLYRVRKESVMNTVELKMQISRSQTGDMNH